MLGEVVERPADRRATRGGRRARPRTPTPRLAARGLGLGHRSSRTSRSSSTPARSLGVVALEGQGQDELFDILAGVERPSGGELARRRRARHVPPSGRRHPRRRRLRRGRPGRGPADAALGPREHRAAAPRPAPAAGARSTSAGEAQDGRRRRRDAPDRRARPGRGPPPVGRQPAEGHDRPLGRRRRPDDALLRPDPRHRHPHQEPDLRAAARPRRGRARRSCSTRPSSRRSSSSATGRS